MTVVLSLAFRYLLARARQSALTTGGIAVGVIALTVIQAMMGGFRENFVQKTLGTSAHITVRRRSLDAFDPASPTKRALHGLHDPLLVQVARPPLPDEQRDILNPSALQARLREVPGVAATAPLVGGQVMLGFSGAWEPVTLNGVVPTRQARMVQFAQNFQSGTVDDLERNPHGIVLGTILAERLRVGVGDRVVARALDGTPVSLRVVALYRSMVYDVDSGTAWANLARTQAVLGLGGAVNAVQVRTVDFNRADEVAAVIERAVGLDAESWMEANQNTLGLLTMFGAIMYVVTAFTMTVAGFGIAGNLVMTVSEKTFDIGVLKAMGMPAARISAVFLVLAFLMMSIGLGIGLTASYFLVEAIGRIPTAIRPQPGMLVISETLPVLRSWSMYAVSAVFALVVSVAAGLSPALRAARLEPLGIIRNAAG